EQAHLDEAVAALKHQRCGALAAVEHALTRSRYRTLKTAVETWLEQPRYTSIATLPLFSLLPDLLSPLLSSLLLHPGWLVEAADTSEEANETLHDLRKACKHARYQAEFFAPFYNADFQTWTNEVKDIQATLGSVHDRQVLTDLLIEHQPKRGKLASLHTLIEQSNAADMADWDDRRQKYLSAEFRQSLRRLILDAVRSPGVPTPTNAMN
ncbi:CHAD domain-containing protein, partial [Leptolyngbya sp. FACHB-36]|uniref:CHAD domain-containing protein n=1 Tax=Leptolyngbya sp. FACHB-36 TaxID=2692808 RepID=UPI0016815686